MEKRKGRKGEGKEKERKGERKKRKKKDPKLTPLFLVWTGAFPRLAWIFMVYAISCFSISQMQFLRLFPAGWYNCCGAGLQREFLIPWKSFQAVFSHCPLLWSDQTGTFQSGIAKANITEVTDILSFSCENWDTEIMTLFGHFIWLVFFSKAGAVKV